MRPSDVDAFLIRRAFSPVAWFIERRTGRNNFRQAMWVMQPTPVMAVASHLLSVTLYHRALTSWLVWVLYGLLFLSVLRRIHVWRAMAERAEKKPSAITALDKSAGPGSRLFVIISALLFLPFDLAKIPQLHGWLILIWPAELWYLFYACAFYLAAVPRPPARTQKQSKSIWLARPAFGSSS